MEGKLVFTEEQYLQACSWFKVRHKLCKIIVSMLSAWAGISDSSPLFLNILFSFGIPRQPDYEICKISTNLVFHFFFPVAILSGLIVCPWETYVISMLIGQNSTAQLLRNCMGHWRWNLHPWDMTSRSPSSFAFSSEFSRELSSRLRLPLNLVTRSRGGYPVI